MKLENKLLQIGNIENMHDGDFLNGLCLVQSSSKAPTKNGGFYRAGKVSTSDGMVDYKSWSKSSAYDTMEKDDMTGKIVSVVSKVNEYGGVKSLIIESMEEINIANLGNYGLTEYDFLYNKYNIDAYWTKLNTFIEKNVSENAYKVFKAVTADLEEDFKNEFAAVSHHDACRGGLLAHTLKVTQSAVTLGKLYPELMEKVGVDLLCVGAALHDIGKVVEYKHGGISETGMLLPHPVLGTLIISKHEEEIVELMGRDFYLNLLSIVSSHHGEMGEPPRTVGAYFVFCFDYLDSRLTALNELLESNDGNQVAFDGFKLN